jgi:2-oxoglutarate ferredoxin oxidoreductase subunit delta
LPISGDKIECINGDASTLKTLLNSRCPASLHRNSQAIPVTVSPSSRVFRVHSPCDPSDFHGIMHRTKEFTMAKGTVVIHEERCKGCTLCVAACPQHVLTMSNHLNLRGYRTVALDEGPGQCTGCAICAIVCPDVVFSVYREPVHRRTAAPVMAVPVMG